MTMWIISLFLRFSYIKLRSAVAGTRKDDVHFFEDDGILLFF